ncbi:hypothetical protein GWI33_004161 [Rhynchophorus ferrugineus]|uniref:Uncharacterized protein n=1 Tax=Rhynchophorus ferrugineus TaxID=354439 RepID=A0A834HI20_RHYFE|nr:hypothetical protein GWI33_004166 [Rhynchophorus ferrugineus]KAF7262748.1 hypothetical protein GWI33_004161 [Rhynchophorus ferrugineus]
MFIPIRNSFEKVLVLVPDVSFRSALYRIEVELLLRKYGLQLSAGKKYRQTGHKVTLTFCAYFAVHWGGQCFHIAGCWGGLQPAHAAFSFLQDNEPLQEAANSHSGDQLLPRPGPRQVLVA